MKDDELSQELARAKETGDLSLLSGANDASLAAILRELERSSIEVTVLRLDGADISDHGLETLASSPSMACLDRLDVTQTRIGDRGMRALAASPHLANLRCLFVSETQVTDDGITAVAQSPYLVSLGWLWLRRTQIGDVGVQALAQSHNMISLNRLFLTGTRVSDEGVMALADSPHMAALQWLELQNTRVGNAAVQALAGSPYMAALSNLNLQRAAVGDLGVKALANSPHLAALEELTLNSTQVGDEGAVALADSPHMAALQTLKLVNTKVGDEGVYALATSPYLAALETLHLASTRVKLPEQFKNNTDARAILKYFRESRTGKPLLEIKACVLGMGRTGKSELCRRLAPRDDREARETMMPNRDPTHAFEIRARSLNVCRGEQLDCKLRLFDFGGQQELHGAHRFFLADQRNVYVIVVSARKTRTENKLDYWLRMVRWRGGSAPTIVVVSHCDEQPAADDHRTRSANPQSALEPLDAAALSRLHGIPVEVVTGYSNVDGKNQEQVESAIARAVAQLSSVFEDPYPPELLEVKSWLEGVPTSRLTDQPLPSKHLHLHHFRKACKQCGQHDDQQQKLWLILLRDMGVVHWVGDRPEVARNAEHRLRHMLFNPNWVKDPVYAIIREASVHRGLLSAADVAEILIGRGLNRGDDCELLTALMLECDLCFKVQSSFHAVRIRQNEPEYLVIDGLPATDPQRELKNWSGSVKLIWRFDFLPDHLLAQLLGRKFMWRDETSSYYRDEIVLCSPDPKVKNCRVRIRPLPEDRREELIARRCLDLPAGCCLELEFATNSKADWQYLRTRIEDEVIKILDPEGITDQPAARRPFEEIDPENLPEARLTLAEMKLIQQLVAEVAKHFSNASGHELSLRASETLRHDLARLFLATGVIRQDSPRLAYRACYVVFCIAKLTGEQPLGQDFPRVDETEFTRQVGHWFERNVIFLQLFSESNNKLAKTLTRSEESKDFDPLRKAYGIARRAMADQREFAARLVAGYRVDTNEDSGSPP